MNRIISHLNIVLVCCNILGLGSYLFNKIIVTHQYIYLVVMFVASLPNLEQYAQFKRIHFCIIGTIAVTATFLKDQRIDIFLCSVSLAYATNLGYLIINKNKDEMKIKFYESSVNLSFSFAVFISIFNAYMEVSKLTAKIFILVTVLPNFYLSYNDQSLKDNSIDTNRENRLVGQRGEEIKDMICNKLIYCLNPLLGQTLPYAFGYGIGIYINIFQILALAKYVKYLIVALLILIQTLTYKQLIKMICLFLRSILVFHYQRDKHKYESYFIFIYLVLTNFMHSDVVNLYLMLGYAVIAVVIWREEYQGDLSQSNKPGSHIAHNENSNLVERKDYDHQNYNEHEIQMPLIPQKDYSLSASRRNASF